MTNLFGMALNGGGTRWLRAWAASHKTATARPPISLATSG
jgi:hypothetical protein